MHILVIDEEFPYPPNTGKRIRSFNLLSRLATRHDLHYMAYGHEDSDSYRMLQRMNMNPLPVSPRVPPKSGLLFYTRLAANLLSRQPYVVTSHYSRAFRKALNDFLRISALDLIICEWSPYAIFVRDIPDVKKLVVAHNIEARIWQRYYANEKNPLKKWYIGKQMAKLGQFERAAYKWADGATAVSEVDADEILSYNHHLPVKVVDNGVDLEYFRPDGTEPDKNSLVYVGTMDWRPNQDAAVYFVEEILPIIAARRPETKISLVGRKPPAHIKALDRHSAVTVTGSVDDIRPYIRHSAVYVVPLRIGGGTRLKILDAMAMGRAIVSTSVGAEGLDVSDGENIMLADTPQEFADRVVELLEDDARRRRLGAAGRALVEAHYSWDRLVAKLDDFIRELVGDK